MARQEHEVGLERLRQVPDGAAGQRAAIARPSHHVHQPARVPQARARPHDRGFRLMGSTRSEHGHAHAPSITVRCASLCLTSANGWRGSGASYAKLARGLRERGHVAHLVTAAPKLTDRLREEGPRRHPDPGRDTGPREVWALRRDAGAGSRAGHRRRYPARRPALVLRHAAAPRPHRLPLQPQLPPAPHPPDGPGLSEPGRRVRLSVAVHPGATR